MMVMSATYNHLAGCVSRAKWVLRRFDHRRLSADRGDLTAVLMT